jgi:succinyl-diaminopimelate desuccinylase
MKIGRRSTTAFFTLTGVQGHSAYPHRAKNSGCPHGAVDGCAIRVLDQAQDHFDPHLWPKGRD